MGSHLATTNKIKEQARINTSGGGVTRITLGFNFITKTNFEGLPSDSVGCPLHVMVCLVGKTVYIVR